MKVETIEDVAKLIEFAKNAGLSVLEIDNLKIKFSSKSMYVSKKKKEDPAPVPDLKAEDIVKSHAFLDDLTPEEILFYATPHFDELQADKEHKKQLIEESV